MAIVRTLAEARRDLREIARDIRQHNPSAASRLIDDIAGRFPLLASQPLMGVACDELRPGLRKFTVRGYLIFYFPLIGVGVEIVRVIDGRRDYRLLL